MKKVYIVSAVRTPLGSFGGKLAGFSAIDLGVFAAKSAMERAGIQPDQVQELIYGNVLSANLGQAPAKQVALGAGIPDTIPCTIVNKVCASGMKAIMFGAQSIMLGHNDIVLAGGTESMSNVPFYVPKARFGYKYGSGKLVDGLENDGLKDPFDLTMMGDAGDFIARDMQISREEQDEYAIRSYTLAAETTKEGVFKDEIVPVSIPQRKKDPILMDEDEDYTKVFFEKIPSLRPVFNKDGTVTAANASNINDGASALVLCSEEKVKELGLKPLAVIRGFADAAENPKRFTVAPARATPIALGRAGIGQSDIELFEVNEAFAVVPLVYNRVLKVPVDQMNVHGGAVSIGHPLGASGARIVTTLINALKHKGKTMGCAAICNGGGGASAMVIEKV